PMPTMEPLGFAASPRPPPPQAGEREPRRHCGILRSALTFRGFIVIPSFVQASIGLLLGEQAVRARLPAKAALRLGPIVLLLGLIAGDEEGVEAAVAHLNRLQGSEVRRGEVFLVGDEQRPALAWRAWVGAFVEVLLASARAGDPQRDDVHVP